MRPRDKKHCTVKIITTGRIIYYQQGRDLNDLLQKTLLCTKALIFRNLYTNLLFTNPEIDMIDNRVYKKY